MDMGGKKKYIMSLKLTNQYVTHFMSLNQSVKKLSVWWTVARLHGRNTVATSVMNYNTWKDTFSLVKMRSSCLAHLSIKTGHRGHNYPTSVQWQLAKHKIYLTSNRSPGRSCLYGQQSVQTLVAL